MKLAALEKMKRGEHALIVLLGDSITEINYHLHGHLNYAGLLQKRLLEAYGRNALFINAGVSGNTTRNLLARLTRDALQFKPDLVTLMIGVNDCGKGVPLEEYAQNLETLIASIRQSGSEVLLLTQHPLHPGLPEIAEKYGEYPDFMEAARTVAKRLEVHLCDIYEGWQTALADHPNRFWSLMNDPLHPNERGHRLTAQLVLETLGLTLE
ncbi:SGNH/GDSL hydrolase family protein [Paenibacillus sp. MBLB4367]|uniref:SGNH/GDSL hydrolase family protein n=1 Tax=Paenibacillus sp. MBLB4367 TaxID=3384767 RepID=UPI00390815D0